MNRRELQQLALDRVEDARILLDQGRWTAAYYLVGYAVETGLKACILKYVEETGVIFSDKKFAERCWTHDIEALVRQANLEQPLGRDRAANLVLDGNWSVAEKWSEDSRYSQRAESEAKELFEAIVNPGNGVFPWLQRNW